MPIRLFVVVALRLASSARPAAASEVGLCAKNDPRLPALRRGIHRFDEEVRQLKAASPLAPVAARLDALLEHPCLALAKLERQEDRPDSALSLQRWWNEGGDLWLSLYVDFDFPSQVAFPPSFRKTLSRKIHPDAPQAEQFCPDGDEACAAPVLGWERRADRYFHSDLDDSSDEAEELTQCASACEERSYGAWHACADGCRAELTAVPAGHLRQPSHGWLFVSGGLLGRGDCWGTRAYDLATGAGFVAAGCREVFRNEDGTEDVARTKASSATRVRAGLLHPDNLAEALWAALLDKVIVGLGETDYRPYMSAQLPAHMGRLLDPEQGFGQGRGYGMGFNSDQSTLDWSWVDGGRRQAGGHLELGQPKGHNGVSADYFLQLLEVAERSFQEGCPPVQPPGPRSFGPPSKRQSAEPVKPEALLEADVVEAFSRFRCAKPQPPPKP